jgi:hypothetical protein
VPQTRTPARTSTKALEHREQMTRSKAPSTRNRASVYDELGLQGYLGGQISARHLPLRVLHDMRTDAILMFASLVALVPIFTAKWRIRCRDAQLAQFVQEALKRIYGRLVVQLGMARDFGFQALVKEFGMLQPDWMYLNRDAEGGAKLEPVWDHDFKALVWEPFVALKPENVEPAWARDGSLDGIKMKTAAGFQLEGYSFPALPFIDATGKEDPEHAKIPLERSLWVVNQRDSQFGSVWGYPRLGYAYKFWRASELTLNVLSRSIEKKGDPVVVVRYPVGSSSVGGQEVDNRVIAEKIARQARSGSMLLIPSDGHDESEGGAKNPKWGVEYLKVEENFERLQAILDYLDTMKFRSMSISELAVAEGSGGTSSRNVAGETAVRSAEAQFLTQVEHDDIINRYMIPQLIEENFPEKRDVPCVKETLTFGEDEIDLQRTLLESFANANSDKLPIDWRPLMERFKIDTLEGAELEAWQQRLITQASSQQPAPTQTPPAGGDAGVTDTGFYYDAKGLIELGDEDAAVLHGTVVQYDDALLAELPKSKHFSDASVLAQTRLIRSLWGALLKEQYESFAAFLETDPDLNDEVGLAEDDERAEKAADGLIKAWRFSSARTRRVIKRTGDALKAIFARAGELELRRSGVSLDDWNPEERELARWVQDNAASMVRSAEETTRKQLRSFLVEQVKADANAKQIAAAARKHFAEYPGWRATRLARTEVRRFYNAATLFAAQAAGVKQVQALDGRHGNSDPDCIARDGRFFTIEAAFKEDQEEHPNGTLAWRIINRKTALSIAHAPDGEAGEWAAWCDEETDTVYLREGLSPAAQAHYLRQVGDWLENVP